MVALRDSILARKHGGIWNFVFGLVDIPAKTKLELTYTVPKGYAYIPVEHSFEPMPSQKMKYSLYVDGDLEYHDVTPSICWEGVWFKPISYFIIHEITAIVENLDTATHTYGGITYGFLIPLSNLDAFIEEVTGRKQLKVLEDIRDWLMKTLK